MYVLIPFVKPVALRVCMGIMVAAIGALATLFVPLSIQLLVDGRSSANQEAVFWTIAAIILLLGVLEAGAIALRRWLVGTPGTLLEAAMRIALFSKILELPLSIHSAWSSGELLTRTMADLHEIRQWLTFYLVQMVVDITVLVGGLILLFYWNVELGTAFSICLLPAIYVSIQFQNTYVKNVAVRQKTVALVATSVEECVHGFRVAKAYGQEKYFLERYQVLIGRLMQVELELARRRAKFSREFSGIPAVATTLCLLFGSLSVAYGSVSVGELFGFFGVIALMQAPMRSLGVSVAGTVEAKKSVDRFVALMGQGINLDGSGMPEIKNSNDSQIHLENINFSYSDSLNAECNLRGINLLIEQGKTVAIVGHTGSGKSTLLNLLTKQFTPTSGSIYFRGKDLRKICSNEFVREFSMVFDEPLLFSVSIRNNIIVGRAGISDLDVHRAIENAGAQFVYSLPGGLDSVLKDEGLDLSGGERQRLSIARALVTKPSVLLMDDPFSSLDLQTTRSVEESLSKLRGSITLIIATHRLSTALLADLIIVMSGGKIVASGPHHTLKSSSPEYRRALGLGEATA